MRQPARPDLWEARVWQSPGPTRQAGASDGASQVIRVLGIFLKVSESADDDEKHPGGETSRDVRDRWLILGIIVPYLFLRRPPIWGILAALGVAAAIMLVRWIVARQSGFGAREAVTAWGLTPETPPAQWAIGVLYVSSSAVGALIGSFVSIRVGPRRNGRTSVK